MSKSLEEAIREFLQGRPPIIHALAREFPPGLELMMEGVRHWLIGWTEEEELIFSPVDPQENYEGALQDKIYVCADHFRALPDWKEHLRHRFYEVNQPRLQEFVSRLRERGDAPSDVCATCIDVDDPSWTELVDVFMPGHDWNQYRVRGERPVARGLAGREGIENVMKVLVPDLGQKMATLPRDQVIICVFAAGGASVYAGEETSHG